jgi:myo-inositol 2-dehydrogenase / D-chiro-inositol 1-dehydrogenase
MTRRDGNSARQVNRRDFVRGSLAAASLPLLAPALGLAADAQPAPAKPAEITRKIKLGVVGQGGRGGWIAKLFKQHGGFEMFGVADYFQEVADRAGDGLGVDKSRRFSGLSGYKRLIECGIEAIALETPPYFFPEHAKAAVDAGLHVYMAKPVAVDVPGSLMIEAAGKAATQKKRCFHVDYQMPTEPINIEVAQRIRDGGLGKLAFLATFGFGGSFPDPPKTATIESRLQGLIWVNDIAMGGDLIGNYDIHAIDAALWVVGQRPVSAAGASRICRPDPHGDSRDVCSVVYEFADGLVLNHTGNALKDNADGLLLCQIFGQTANAQVNYWGKAFVRGGDKHFGGGAIENLYENGANRNIAAFYGNVTQGHCENPTVSRAVDGILTCILGREAAARHARLTMAELLKENKRLEVDLKGLKA